MNLSLPAPLHPAIVHFPIVLVLLGAAAAVLAAAWRKHQLPVFAAVLLGMGAAGCWIAVETGEEDGERIENSGPAIKSMLRQHEHWAERTLGIAAAAAAFAIASVATTRLPKLSRATAMLAALAALAASYAVYQTGHHGGALVYRDVAGTTIVENNSGAASHRAALDAD